MSYAKFKDSFSPEIEKTKTALTDAYCRLKAVFDDIDKHNQADDFDALELAIARRESLFERVEYLKARLQTEALEFLKQRKEELPGEILELKSELNKYLRALDDELRPKILEIFTTLLELGGTREHSRRSAIALPDGYSKFFNQAIKDAANKTEGAKIRKEIQGKEMDLESGSPVSLSQRVEHLAMAAATEESGFDFLTHFFHPYNKNRR